MVYKVYSITTVNMGTKGYIGVCKAYSIARVNIGTQDI